MTKKSNMRSLIFTLSIIIFLSFKISSCQIQKEVIKSNSEPNEKMEMVKLDFEILTDEISLDEINALDDYKERIIAYWDSEILATIKQTNYTNKNIDVDNFIIYENFEIINLAKERKDDLIRFYDYTPVFDPETYESESYDKLLEPNESSLDTLNLVNDFRFYKSDLDTLLIRIKKQYFEKEIFSNWDTLIIK